MSSGWIPVDQRGHTGTTTIEVPAGETMEISSIPVANFTEAWGSCSPNCFIQGIPFVNGVCTDYFAFNKATESALVLGKTTIVLYWK